MPGLRRASALALIAGLAGAAMAAPAMAQSCHGAPTGVRVSLTVQGVRSDKGNVAAVVFGDDQRRYLKPNGELETVRDPAAPGTTTLCFWLPKAGDYALFVYHDANANGDIDTGLLGIPKEGFAFSNNVRPKLSAPSFHSTHFTAGPGETSLTVQLHYR
ncbi:DUF2141 domain-containing protein [Caulobacter sp. KR2-114]|uniref:DUF2141 domain-containing protein n=1 Tax=Caulobacter sp. KR2-114 TaxID=3400912 RepID=UPI003C0A6088